MFAGNSKKQVSLGPSCGGISVSVCVINGLNLSWPLTVDWGGKIEWDADIF